MLALRRAYNRRFPQEENPFYRYVRVPIPLEEDNKPDSAQEQEQGEKQLTEEGKAVSTEKIIATDAVDVKMELDPPADASTSPNPDAAPIAEPIPSTFTGPPAVPPVALEPTTEATIPGSPNGGPFEEREGNKAEVGEGEPTEGAPQVDEAELDYYEDRIDVEWSEVDLETKVRYLGRSVLWLTPSTELTLISPPRFKPSTTSATGT